MLIGAQTDKVPAIVNALEVAFEMVHPTERPEIFVPEKFVADGDGQIIQLREQGSRQKWYDYETPVERAVATLLETLGVNLEDENYRETPKRVAKFLKGHFRSSDDVTREIESLRRAVFPSKYPGVITVGPTRAYGLCPHHLLPVIYDITVAYIPEKVTIGISKLARLPRLVAQQPQLQEDMTTEIAEAFRGLLDTDHVAVLVKGRHMCMCVRGVEQDRAVTTTSEMHGFFEDSHETSKMEFFQIARDSK